MKKSPISGDAKDDTRLCCANHYTILPGLAGRMARLALHLHGLETEKRRHVSVSYLLEIQVISIGLPQSTD